uniref:Uncharacterized protein n=2 Tax=Anguilla anguilla TaxID=7936 RepID=A0A0E9TGG2_ANGAN
MQLSPVAEIFCPTWRLLRSSGSVTS